MASGCTSGSALSTPVQPPQQQVMLGTDEADEADDTDDVEIDDD